MPEELTYSQLDEEGRPYVVRRKDDPDTRLGFVWKCREGAGVDGDDGSGPLRWEAIDAPSGERSGPVFSTRGEAGDWLLGKWSVREGPASEFIPEDPFEGLPGA